MKLHVVLAVLALTWTCWSVDAFKLTSSKKPQKVINDVHTLRQDSRLLVNYISYYFNKVILITIHLLRPHL